MQLTTRDRALSVRAIGPDELDAWLRVGAADPSADAIARRLTGAWSSGSSAPDRTFVLERRGEPVGRVAYVAEPAATVLPDVHEASVLGLWLPWAAPHVVELGRELLRRTFPSLRPPIRFVDAYANPSYMVHVDIRRAIFEGAGMSLFQEKRGFRWDSAGRPGEPPAGPGRLTFRALPEVGRDLLASVMSRATIGTLDRQDRYYSELVGPENWGPEMLGYLTPEDEADWLLAYDKAGDPVGYALLSTFERPDRGTIAHIGVVPEARGRGYVDELLAELEQHARRRGFTQVLSDSDVANHPMHAAFERAGHRSAATDWHVWHYRLEL